MIGVTGHLSRGPLSFQAEPKTGNPSQMQAGRTRIGRHGSQHPPGYSTQHPALGRYKLTCTQSHTLLHGRCIQALVLSFLREVARVKPSSCAMVSGITDTGLLYVTRVSGKEKDMIYWQI